MEGEHVGPRTDTAAQVLHRFIAEEEEGGGGGERGTCWTTY